jgi:hypothetical protein
MDPIFSITNPAGGQMASEYIPHLTAIISSFIAGVSAYMVGKRRSTKSEFSELVVANKKFRDEIKLELNEAKLTIVELEKMMIEKGRLIEALQMDILDLKQQLIIRETRIADMQIEIIKKDYKINKLIGDI